jgi:DNA-directed RNA polymerase specialized sigma24 family protein
MAKSVVEAVYRTEKLLALLLLQLTKAAPQREKVVQLSLAGFTNTEIADLLQTTTAVVAQQLYEAKKNKGKKKPKKK